MARLLILTVGSRGDVQPYIALGRGLQARGHQVTLATSTDFEPFVTRHGLAYARLRADFMALLETPEGRATFSGGSKLGLMKKVMPMLRHILDDAWDAAQGVDALIYHPKPLAGPHLAEKLGVPGILALPAPILSPTRAFPNPILPPGLRLGGWFNRLSYVALTPLMTMPYRGLINTWRAEKLGLPPRPGGGTDRNHNGQPAPVLYAFSPSLVPVPADWPPAVTATGFWFLDEGGPNWQPPAALRQFLEAGPPPVYVGFGSMVGRDPRASAELAVAALRQAGLRGVLAAGAGGLRAGDVPPEVFALDSAPHDWLFPRMAAVVHHGGAGTTAAGLRAGKPSVVCPFFGDQAFWGYHVHKAGAGPQPVAQKTLTVDKLAAALRAAGEPQVRQRAAELGRQIQAEDGVARAVGVIERALIGESQHVTHSS